jgi:hypothetical protein
MTGGENAFPYPPTRRQCFRTEELVGFVVVRWARSDTRDSLKHFDKLVDDLVNVQRS